LVLVLGGSTGYGLASRIAAAFGYGAATVGLSMEKAASKSSTATPGYYNNAAFEKAAAAAGLVFKTLDGNAFSDEMKAQAAEALRQAAKEAGIEAKADLVVYSLATPVRTDPKTGITHKSAIKPIGGTFSGKTLDIMSGTFSQASAESASDGEIADTVKVMGGEDLELWVDALAGEGLLAPDCRVVAYSYIGPEHSWPIYKNGTIGRAKEDLERACRDLNAKYAGKIAGAWLSVNKALVTRSSAVIPIIPLYLASLFKVMKDAGLHEGCIEQIVRLYSDRLYAGGAVPVDGEGRIRIDDWEMREDVQKKVAQVMESVTPENVFAETDIEGVKHDFFEAHGFDMPGIDYDSDIEV
ncbi:MAG: trans-2-enoyl-CoA reductase family protein, partial [Spirochaetes bacterium]|nr:trans-2-enoyl-CoA reductase family protein [Spirochaetota bacterium]